MITAPAVALLATNSEPPLSASRLEGVSSETVTSLVFAARPAKVSLASRLSEAPGDSVAVSSAATSTTDGVGAAGTGAVAKAVAQSGVLIVLVPAAIAPEELTLPAAVTTQGSPPGPAAITEPWPFCLLKLLVFGS